MAMDVPLSSSSSSNTSGQDDPVESCSDRDIHSRMNMIDILRLDAEQSKQKELSLVVTHRESLLKELFILVGQPEEHSDNVLRFLQGRNDESKHDPETWHTFLKDQSLGTNPTSDMTTSMDGNNTQSIMVDHVTKQPELPLDSSSSQNVAPSDDIDMHSNHAATPSAQMTTETMDTESPATADNVVNPPNGKEPISNEDEPLQQPLPSQDQQMKEDQSVENQLVGQDQQQY